MSWFKQSKDNAPGHDYEPGALESTMHWQVIWPRTIALAWGYHLMDDLDLTIEDAPEDATFDPALATNPAKGSPQDPWAKLPQLRLTLSIPPAPPAELQGVAITAYQDTGRTYPFTCC